MPRRVLIPLVMLACAALGVGAAYFFLPRLHSTPDAGPRTSSNAPAAEPSATTAPPTQPSWSATEFYLMHPRAQAQRVPVIMYHDVVKARGRGSVWFDCTVREFAAHLAFLEEHDAHPVSLLQLHRHLTLGEELPENPVVLTFDDNYQGFFDNAYPLLKVRKWPAAMFVHTNFVGDKKSAHPKMDWNTLQTLDREGLLTIGSHTLSHPDDISTLLPSEQSREMEESKRILEERLGHPIPYFAYPNGKNNATTQELAKAAGYTMAFTIANGNAEESPNILALNRWIHTRFEKAWEEAKAAQENAPAAVVQVDLKPSPVRLEVGEWEGVRLALAKGGAATSHLAEVRQGVGEFVKQTGAVAGINGTFFVNASLKGTDNRLIGPRLSLPDKIYTPDLDPLRAVKLVNRPLVVWGPNRLMLVNYQPAQMSAPEVVAGLMPEATDVFLGGAWIVHNGVARTQEQMTPYATKDFPDPRRRAFFGVTKEGEPVLGATLSVVSTMKMAEAAVEAGVQEAVLLDSGFSTSLVYGDKVLVTGHTAPGIPSRPVPHAIVLTGEKAALTPEMEKVVSDAPPANVLEAMPEEPRPRRRRRRRRRTSARQVIGFPQRQVAAVH